MIEQLLQADRLLSVDQVDQAETLYRRVFQNDPLDAIAVVGLARCALARGDDRRAHELAAQALGIDPENDMARRMEARLAEILAVRGGPAPRPPTAALPPTREMRPAVTGDAPSVAVTRAPAAVTRAPAAPPAPPRSFLDRLLGRA